MCQGNVNCWTQAQVDRCITCLDGWEDLQGWQRMERAREGYGDFPSKPYGWVKEAGFVVATAEDAEGKKTRTLLAAHLDSNREHSPRQGHSYRGLLRGAEGASRG